MKHPSRGEVWLVDLGMTAKIRPCLVLGIPVEDNERGLITLVPHTTAARGTRLEIAVETEFLRAGAFDVQGLFAAPAKYAIHRLGVLNESDVKLIEAAVGQWLQLPRS